MDVFDDQCVGRGDSQGKTEPLDADEEWINLKEIFGHIGSGQGDPDEETIRQERAEITDHPDHPEDCENCLTDDDDEDLLMALGWLMEKRNAKASARRPKEKTVKELLEELRREIRTEIQTESKAEVQTEKQAEIREDLETELRAELEAEMRARLKAEIEAEMRTRLRAELETEKQAEFQERFEKEISRLDVRAEALLSLIERAEERLNEVEQAQESQDERVGRDSRDSRDAREVRDRRRFTPAEEEDSEEYLEEEPFFGGKTNTGGFFRTLAISILLAPFIYRGFLWMSDLSYELRAFPLCIAVGAVLLLVTNGASSFRSFLDKLEEDDFEEEVYRKRR